jgi:hypothetical protein
MAPVRRVALMVAWGKTLDDGEGIQDLTSSRITQARETLAAIRTLQQNPTREAIAAYHRRHARHLRTESRYEMADRAEARANAVRLQH